MAPNWLGDAVMSIPLLEAVREMFPGCSITAGCRDYVSPIYRGSGLVDSIVDWDRGKGLLGEISMLRKSSPPGGYDLAFVLPVSFSSALAASMSRSRERIGYAGEGRNLFLTTSLRGGISKERHLSASYLAILEEYVGKKLGRVPLPRIDLPPDWSCTVRSHGIEDDYFVIAPGATYGEAKMWPSESFRSLAQKVVEETGWMPVAVGSPSERETGDSILPGSGAGSVNLAGRCSVGEMISVLGGARLVVGNDSGPVHISAALGRPTVAIFGSTSPEWTAPRGEKVAVARTEEDCSPCFKKKCPNGDMRCMRDITVDRVFKQVSGLIA